MTWQTITNNTVYCYIDYWGKGAQQADKQYCLLLYKLLEKESVATWQTTLSTVTQTVVGREHSILTSTQCQLHSELVEGSSWARGPDENLLHNTLSIQSDLVSELR